MSEDRRVVAKISEAAKLADDSNTDVCEAEVANESIMNHVEAMQLFRDSLAEIIIGDPFLSHLHTSVTLEELHSYISLEHGQAVTVNVMRGDDIALPIVVLHDATVADLRKAFQRHVVLKQTRENHTTHINWRHVWRSYWFYFNGQKLTVSNKKLKDYDIHNNDTVTFIKKLRKR